MEYRFAGKHDKYGNSKPLPSQKIEVHPDRLKRFNTRKPKVFAIWNDLFHDAVPDDFIDEVYGVIGLLDNTYLILTKRPARMESTLNRLIKSWSAICKRDVMLPNNIWHGLTVCNQQEADEKIPIFLQVPGRKFLSIEPMLGPIDLERPLPGPDINGVCQPWMIQGDIDAVILGGETGPGARPLHPDWVRSVRDQCAAAGVPFFLKQWGEYVPVDNNNPIGKHLTLIGKQWVDRVGRKKAGRLLDGRTHDELPWREI
jgi:protein gp37